MSGIIPKLTALPPIVISG